MSTASARLSPAVPAVLLLLRLVAGLIMAYHGLGKFQGGIPNFAGAVQSLGFPAPTLLAWIVALLELVGGLLVVVGLFSRVAAALIALEMLITGVYVKLIKAAVGLIGPADQPGVGAEVDFLYLGGLSRRRVPGPRQVLAGCSHGEGQGRARGGGPCWLAGGNDPHPAPRRPKLAALGYGIRTRSQEVCPRA